MKNLVICLTVAVAILAVINIVQLQKKPVETTAVFDIAKAVSESDAGKEAKALSTNFETALTKRDLEPLYNDLLLLQKKYTENEKKLTPKEKSALEQEFNQKQSEMERRKQIVMSEIQKLNNALGVKTMNEITPIVEEIAKSKQYKLVISPDSAFYKDLPDITDEVIVKYNDFFKKQKAEEEVKKAKGATDSTPQSGQSPEK